MNLLLAFRSQPTEIHTMGERERAPCIPHEAIGDAAVAYLAGNIIGRASWRQVTRYIEAKYRLVLHSRDVQAAVVRHGRGLKAPGRKPTLTQYEMDDLDAWCREEVRTLAEMREYLLQATGQEWSAGTWSKFLRGRQIEFRRAR